MLRYMHSLLPLGLQARTKNLVLALGRLHKAGHVQQLLGSFAPCHTDTQVPLNSLPYTLRLEGQGSTFPVVQFFPFSCSWVDGKPGSGGSEGPKPKSSEADTHMVCSAWFKCSRWGAKPGGSSLRGNGRQLPISVTK